MHSHPALVERAYWNCDVAASAASLSFPRGSDLPFFDGLLGRPQKRRIPSFLEKMEDLVLCDKSSVFGATCLHLHKTAGNWKPETGNRKLETRNRKAETGTRTGTRTRTGT